MFFSLPKVVILASLTCATFGSPMVRTRRDVNIVNVPNSSSGLTSFDNWGGFSSLSNFDNFFGGHFDGFYNEQVIIDDSLTCSSSIESLIIQQQLSILQEVAKQIILQQVCDVEAQILYLDQFRSGFFDFEDDLRHLSGRNIGFDSSISSLLLHLLNSDGSLNSIDFGFNGVNIGQHFQVVGGSNWNEQSSPSSINSLLQLINTARNNNGRQI